jgi:hypothetical protein
MSHTESSNSPSGHTTVPLELRNSSQFPFPYSTFSAQTTHRKHSSSTVAWRTPHRKHMLCVRLRVHWSITSTGTGADDIENTASCIIACRTVFRELLPGNTLFKSVILCIYVSYILNLFLIFLINSIQKSAVGHQSLKISGNFCLATASDFKGRPGICLPCARLSRICSGCLCLLSF